VTNSDEKLHAVLATLEECQAALVLGGDRDTAQLVSVAILELRIKLNRIEDSELKALCDAVLRDVEAPGRPHDPNPHEGQRRRAPVLLKLVK
jgi:ADP-ribosylglycohydrolase